MQAIGKRIWIVLALGLLAVPVAAAGVAYACTALATVSVSAGSAHAGATVTVSGQGFAPHDDSDIRTAPANVHLDTATGPVIAQASPSSAANGGRFSVDITVPNVSPGQHVLIVTQNGIDGRPAYGTPARTVLEILPAPAAPAAAPAAAAVPEVPSVVAPLVESVPALSPRPSTSSVTRRPTLARRIASCRSRFSAKKAKTTRGKRRMASRRAACIRSARSRSA